MGVASHFSGVSSEPTSSVGATPVLRVPCRTITPPNELSQSTPEFLLSPNVSERVRTRVDSPPSALTFLAAVCSSPSVHWDGRKHYYLESEKSNLAVDVRGEHDIEDDPHIVDQLTLPSLQDFSEQPFPCGSGVIGNDDCDDPGLQMSFVTQEMHFPTPLEDDDVPTSGVSTGPEYNSDFLPSSPTALSLSSPPHRMSYDFTSSSERSMTLPLSSPGPPYLKKTPPYSAINVSEASNAPIAKSCQVEDETSHEARVECSPLKVEPLEVLMPQAEHTNARPDITSHYPKTPTRTRSLSPLHAPSPLFIDPILSPISSLLSSPLSEPFNLEPSAVSSRFSVSSSVVSSRCASPVSSIADDNKHLLRHTSAGRRASTHVISTTSQIGGDMHNELRQRSDTAPPEPTPRKRRRRSSPSSPVLRAFQVQRVNSSHASPSCSKATVTSSTGHQENRQPCRKSRAKANKLSNPVSALSSRLNRLSAQTDGSQQSPFRQQLQPLVSSCNSQAGLDDSSANAIDYSVTELATLPMTGFLVETLALSRASAMAAPELLRAVLKSQPHLLEERSEDIWSVLVRRILEEVQMFGRIERRGTVSIITTSSIACLKIFILGCC